MIDTLNQFKNLSIDLLFANADKISDSGNTQEYKAKLPNPIANLFDSIEFKVGLKDEKFLRDTQGRLTLVSVVFYSESQKQKKDDIKDLVNDILNLYNITDDAWTDVDEFRIDSGVWRGRTIMQDGILYFTLDERGNVKFEIAIYNKFIDRL